jgi:hypothetical protein
MAVSCLVDLRRLARPTALSLAAAAARVSHPDDPVAVSLLTLRMGELKRH